MSRHEWTVLGLKLLSIYLFLTFFVHFGSSFVLMIGNNQEMGNSLLYSVMPLSQCLVAVLLWSFSSRLAEYVWKDAESPEERGSWNLPDLQVALFSAIGLYVFVTTVPQLLQIAVVQQQWQDMVGAPLDDSSFTAQLINLGLRLPLSLWLLFGSESIVRMLQKVRTIGTQKS